MPNGRSGGFLIAKADLAMLLAALPASTTVGFPVMRRHRAGETGGSDAPLSVADTISMVGEFKWPTVWIEEQDHRLYVIHLDHPVEMSGEPRADRWVVVKQESPVFAALRERHEQHRDPSRER